MEKKLAHYGVLLREIKHRIQLGQTRSIQLIVPPFEGVEAYVQQVKPLHKRMVSNHQETSILSALYDNLLPKLFSGKLGFGTKFI